MTTENELILPALHFIKANPTGVTTAELQTQLHEVFNPTGDDITLLSSRNDTKFSQKVRNLKSHNTLERHGLALYDEGKYYLTSAGDFLLGVLSDA